MKPLNQPNGTNTAIDPMCGKRLEPKTVTGGTDDEEYAELRNMTRRFRVCAVLTVPDFALVMAHLIPALARQSWVDSPTPHAGCNSWPKSALRSPVWSIVDRARRRKTIRMITATLL